MDAHTNPMTHRHFPAVSWRSAATWLARVAQERDFGYLASVMGIAVVTLICVWLRPHVGEATVSLAMLLVVLFVATAWGSWPALAASVLGMLCLHYFFLAPIYRSAVAANWTALAAFFITALTVGQLSARAKRMAAEARLAGAYNRRLIETTLDPLVTIGRDGKITDVNAATEIATGRSRKELIGTDFSDYFTDPEKAREGYRRIFREGLVRDYGLELRHREGYTIPVLYNASVYRDEAGAGVGAFAAARDVTELRRAEREIRSLNADLERRVTVRTAELEAANKLKDELIVRARAIGAELEQAREHEVEIGFRIQQNLLLDRPPREVPGLQVAALSIPSEHIDGDFYIFLTHPDQSLDVIVGDVMGKGVAAALLGAATKSHFLKALSHLMALAEPGKPPAPKDIVMLAHAEMARQLIDLNSFVTLCYARLNMTRRVLELVDCGHTGVVHWHARSGQCEVLHGDNLPLGIRAGEIYEQVSAPFEGGDLLLFYSDGITEARNPQGEFFDGERLQEFVQMNADLQPELLVEGIRKAVLTFSELASLNDDLTSVAIRVEEKSVPLARAEIEIRSDLNQLRQAREFVRRFCSQLPGPPLEVQAVESLELAVNEAASNIMKHAYHGHSDQPIQLEAAAYPGYVAVNLHHLGDGFDPSLIGPPPLDGSHESGFGTYLMSQCADVVQYYRDDRGRNCVALTKHRNVRHKEHVPHGNRG